VTKKKMDDIFLVDQMGEFLDKKPAAADAPAVPVDVDAPAVPIAVDAADPDADANAANDANPAVCSDTNDKQEKTEEQAAADARDDAADCECNLLMTQL